MIVTPYASQKVVATVPPDIIVIAFFGIGSPFAVTVLTIVWPQYWWTKISSTVINQQKILIGLYLYRVKKSVETSFRHCFGQVLLNASSLTFILWLAKMIL